ncbi:vegetative incompatibility HET-E-1 [Pyrrhoderma noxium]|uniref:Vegetative incompatibility HET-E-1 n=1 Tax=Pyrrhoderma noxium TaxID=2282107 RepID=A0A286USN5_9AGAM|nr:vegetative incompatibility HET-E-1 [Pyrrhoderma noxium]
MGFSNVRLHSTSRFAVTGARFRWHKHGLSYNFRALTKMRLYKSWVHVCSIGFVLVVALQLSSNIIWRAFVLFVTLPFLLDAFNPSRETVVTEMEIIYEDDETRIDVVAVQGLGSSYPNTWCGNKPVITTDGREAYIKVNWLVDKDLLPSDLRGARILAFKYNSNWLYDANYEDLDGHAQTFLTELVRVRNECHPTRPILFIGHSYGGLVIKKALTLCSDPDKSPQQEIYRAIVHAKQGIVFLGTPHRGAPIAFFARLLCFFYRPFGGAYTGILSTLSDPERLTQLENNFNNVLEKLYYHSVCVYETKGGSGILSSGPLVPRYSATLNKVETLKMECDHTSLNKFKGPTDKRYRQLIDKLKKIHECLTGVSPCNSSGCKGILNYWEVSPEKDSEILFPECKQPESPSEIVITSSASTIESLGSISFNLLDNGRQKIFYMKIKSSSIKFEARVGEDNWNRGQYPYTSKQVSTFRIRSFRDHFCVSYSGQPYIRLSKGPQYNVASMEYTHSQPMVDINKTIPGHLDVEYHHPINYTERELYEIRLAGDVVLPDNGDSTFELVFQSTEVYNKNSGYTAFNLLDSSYRRVLHISLRGDRVVLNTTRDGRQWDSEEVHYFSSFLGDDYSISGFTIRSTQNSYYIIFGEHRVYPILRLINGSATF